MCCLSYNQILQDVPENKLLTSPELNSHSTPKVDRNGRKQGAGVGNERKEKEHIRLHDQLSGSSSSSSAVFSSSQFFKKLCSVTYIFKQMLLYQRNCLRQPYMSSHHFEALPDSLTLNFQKLDFTSQLHHSAPKLTQR